MRQLAVSLYVFLTLGFSQVGFSQANNIVGLYKAVLQHDGTDFYQFAKITLRTVNTSGKVQISANVRIFFGKADSNEYLTYEFADVPLNILTRQISMRTDGNDVSFTGTLKNNELKGEWFSSQVGFVGEFSAQKSKYPEIPEDGILVHSLSGHYRGKLNNTNSESNLPERITMSFVTTQDTSTSDAKVKITGKTRLYLGKFDSLEYVELKFEDIEFNFFNRFLTAKTSEYGLTFKGTMTHDGKFEGVVYTDGLGEVAEVDLSKINR